MKTSTFIKTLLAAAGIGAAGYLLYSYAKKGIIESQCAILSAKADNLLSRLNFIDDTLKYNGHLILASENLIDITTPDIDSKFFDVINELDTDTISLFIFPTGFARNKQRYIDLIGKIRTANKKLYIGYSVEDGLLYPDFQSYKDTEMVFTTLFVSTYIPDFYVIVDEFTTMERRAGIKATEDEWKQFVVDMCDLVKSINSQTRTVVTGHSKELNFLRNIYSKNSTRLLFPHLHHSCESCGWDSQGNKVHADICLNALSQ